MLYEVITSVRRHMDAGSRFVIDTFQPDPAFLGGDPERLVPSDRAQRMASWSIDGVVRNNFV